MAYTHRLSFPDDLEKLFRDDYYHKSILIPVLDWPWLGDYARSRFGLSDVWAKPLSLQQVWFVRFLIICPANDTPGAGHGDDQDFRCPGWG